MCTASPELSLLVHRMKGVDKIGSIETPQTTPKHPKPPQTSTKPPKTTSKHTHTTFLNNFKRILYFYYHAGVKNQTKVPNCMIYTGKKCNGSTVSNGPKTT